MSERNQGPNDNNVISIKDRVLEKMHKDGTVDNALQRAGNEIDNYNKRRQEGKETKGSWWFAVVDEKSDDSDKMKYVVGKDELGKYILLPNNAENMYKQYSFSTDKEAERAEGDIKQLFPELKDTFRLALMCGGIDEEQDDDVEIGGNVVPFKKSPKR